MQDKTSRCFGVMIHQFVILSKNNSCNRKGAQGGVGEKSVMYVLPRLADNLSLYLKHCEAFILTLH